MLPEIDRLPGAQEQSAVVNTQAHGLGGECCADMGWHVAITFVVVQVTAKVESESPRWKRWVFRCASLSWKTLRHWTPKPRPSLIAELFSPSSILVALSEKDCNLEVWGTI